MKRGQISVFIILAIVILGAIILFFLAQQNIINLLPGVDAQVKPVYSFVESCIQQTSEDAIQHISENGGYYIPPNNSLFNGIPIYFNKGETNLLTTQQLEQQLSDYMDEMLFFCTQNFIEFQDFEIQQNQIKTTTEIKENKITFNINYPLSISKEQKTYTFEDFKIEIPANLFKVHQTANQIIEQQKEFPEDICITCLEKFAIDNQLIIEMRDFQESVIFSITDVNSKINDKELIFYFANKY